MGHRGKPLLPLALGIAFLVGGCSSSEGQAGGPVGASASPSAEGRFLYACGPNVFDPALLEAPEGLEQEDPELRELVDSLERSNPDTVDGWRVVSEDSGLAHAMARVPGRGYVSASFERSGNEWTPGRFEDCEPEVVVGLRSPATWELADEPAPSDTELVVIAQEIACSGGRELTQQNTRFHVEYTEEAISIVVTADPIRGGNCVDNPLSRLKVELDEPVGDRELVDAAVYLPERR